MTLPVRAYIGLGSNLERPRTQIERAFGELAALARVRLIARSPLYRTEPIGPAGQPDYVNAAAALDTRLDAAALLEALQDIERAHDRVRAVRWGPRTLDLDLLLYADRASDDPALTLPHPRMHDRRFVLQPLADIAPDLVVPGRGPVVDLLQRCPPLAIRRLP